MAQGTIKKGYVINASIFPQKPLHLGGTSSYCAFLLWGMFQGWGYNILIVQRANDVMRVADLAKLESVSRNDYTFTKGSSGGIDITTTQVNGANITITNLPYQ